MMGDYIKHTKRNDEEKQKNKETVNNVQQDIKRGMKN